MITLCGATKLLCNTQRKLQGTDAASEHRLAAPTPRPQPVEDGAFAASASCSNDCFPPHRTPDRCTACSPSRWWMLHAHASRRCQRAPRARASADACRRSPRARCGTPSRWCATWRSPTRACSLSRSALRSFNCSQYGFNACTGASTLAWLAT